MSKAKVGWLAIAPGLLGALLSAVFIYGVWGLADDIGAWLFSWYKWEKGENLTESLGTWVSFLSLVVLYFLFFKYIVLIIGGPFMSPLSERIEKNYLSRRKTLQEGKGSFLMDLVRALRINVRNLVRELSLTLILTLLSLVPGMATLTGPLLFLLGAYFAGFGNIDYTLERHLSFEESIEFVKRHKGLALGNGVVFMVLFTIPIVGVFLALPLAAAASTISTLDALESSNP